MPGAGEHGFGGGKHAEGVRVGASPDIEVGLTYFGARYLSSQLGSWISPDPMAIHGLAGDLNPYAYVQGRIVTDVDPTGMDDTAAAVAALAAMAPNTTTLTWWVDPTAPKDGDDPYTPTIGQRILGTAFQVAAAALGDSAVGRSDGARFDENGNSLKVIRPQPSALESNVVSNIHAASLVAAPGMKAAVGAALQAGADVVKTAVSRVMLRVTSVAERAPGLAVQTAVQAGGGAGGQVAAGTAEGMEHIALGLEHVVEEQSASVGARHLMTDPNWKTTFMNALAGGNTRFTVFLDNLAVPCRDHRRECL